MTTEQLKCFIKVAENLSFNKAAEQLYISTPGVSRNIRLLEEELGAVLFLRNKHRVVLTRTGRSFYNDAKLMLRVHEQALLHIMESNLSSQLRICCTSYEELPVISDILKRYRTQHPNITPRISCNGYAKCISRLKQQTADLLFGSDNMALDEDGIQFYPFCQLDSLAVVPQSDPLSQLDMISFEKDLADKTIIHMPELMIPFHSQNRIKDLLAIHHRHNHDIECEDGLACIALASAGYGITILPEYKIPAQIPGCVKVRIRENEVFEYGVLTAAGELPSHVESFISTCAQVLTR